MRIAPRGNPAYLSTRCDAERYPLFLWKYIIAVRSFLSLLSLVRRTILHLLFFQLLTLILVFFFAAFLRC